MRSLPSIATAVTEIRAGRLAPTELLETCLQNIAAFEDRVQAWVLVDETGARQVAAQRDQEAQHKSLRGPLHGIPLGIKDIVDVAGFPTQAGSPLRADHRAQRDAAIVARLRDAGAIILGKTVTTQFASFDPPKTCNPWNLERTPGGSSSGSAAAVACGMCLGAIGSQTGGSITRPAAYCGVAGCKPTYGLLSLDGIVPLAFHMDHPGPIARCVADVAVLLNVMRGSLDDISAQSTGPRRLGALQSFFRTAHANVRQSCDAAMSKLNSTEQLRVSPCDPAIDFDAIVRQHRHVMAVEAAMHHRAWFPSRRHEYGPNIAALMDEGRQTSSVDYAAALCEQPQFREKICELLQDYDVLITPAATSTAPGRETTGDPRFNSPWSYAGLPTVCIPCGLADDGLPVSLQFIGRPFDEATLLATAAQCERALEFNSMPKVN